jgi:light-regulated signal transduction histidine kinase (bacteriophytochrome)
LTLRWIAGFAEALREDHADKQSTDSLRLLQNIRMSVERMNPLIEALLQLARFSHSELKRQQVDLSAIVHRVAAELQQGHPTRQVEFGIAEGIAASGDERLLAL